jgi:hypothetical protein
MADSTANMMNYFKMHLFWAALLVKLYNIIAQQDQAGMTIKKMFKITTTSKKESKDSKRIAAMEGDNDSDQEKTEVTAFKKQQSKWQSIRPRNRKYQQKPTPAQPNYRPRPGLGKIRTEMETTATTANSRITDKKSAKEESEKKVCKDTEGSLHTNNGLQQNVLDLCDFLQLPIHFNFAANVSIMPDVS